MYTDDSINDINLVDGMVQPQDTISCIQWIQNQSSKMFATGGWDGISKIYEVVPSGVNAVLTQKASFKVNEPILSCSWKSDYSCLFVGCSDGSIRSIDISKGIINTIGQHQMGISSIIWVNQMNALMSHSYDKNMCFWSLGNNKPAATLPMNYKPFCTDMKYPLMLSGLSQQKLLLFDMNMLKSNRPFSYMDSPLGKNSQIQSVIIGSQKDVIGVGAFDGRANLSSITRIGDEIKNQTIMTFKCHKLDQGGKQLLYPVNTTGFNIRNKKWFYTGGGQGNVTFWDYQAKNKIKTLNYGKKPLTAGKVNHTGDLLAYALGNDWHMGIEGIGKWKPKIAVHYIPDNQLRYKK